MTTIDNSQRMAAKVAGWSDLLTFAIVVIGNYVLLNPPLVLRFMSFFLFKGLRPSTMVTTPHHAANRNI
jgi:hypothetical protein